MNEDIKKYIDEFNGEAKDKLIEIYKFIKEVGPVETVEKISWKMPTFYLSGNLVHFAGFKNHIGLFPGSDGIEKFKNKFTGLSFSKGGVQFKYIDTLPKKLIQDIVKYRVKINKGIIE